MSDGNKVAGLSEKTPDQIIAESYVHQLRRAWSPVGRLNTAENLRLLDRLPEALIDPLREAATTDVNPGVRQAAREALEKHGYYVVPRC